MKLTARLRRAVAQNMAMLMVLILMPVIPPPPASAQAGGGQPPSSTLPSPSSTKVVPTNPTSSSPSTTQPDPRCTNPNPSQPPGYVAPPLIAGPTEASFTENTTGLVAEFTATASPCARIDRFELLNPTNIVSEFDLDVTLNGYQATARLSFITPPDREARSRYLMSIRVFDNQDRGITHFLQIDILNQNETPEISRPGAYELTVLTGASTTVDLENPADGMGAYFTDPDGDPLSYTIIPVSQALDVSVQGSEVTFTHLTGGLNSDHKFEVFASDGSLSYPPTTGHISTSESSVFLVAEVLTNPTPLFTFAPSFTATNTGYPAETTPTKFLESASGLLVGQLQSTVDPAASNTRPDFHVFTDTSEQDIYCAGVRQNPLWSETGDDDSHLFRITTTKSETDSTGQIYLNRDVDFENPTDTDADGVYQLRIAALVPGTPSLGCNGHIMDLSLQVVDTDDSGQLVVSPSAPTTGGDITARLSDQDEVENINYVWSWRENETAEWQQLQQVTNSQARTDTVTLPASVVAGSQVRVQLTYDHTHQPDYPSPGQFHDGVILTSAELLVRDNVAPVFSPETYSFDLPENTDGQTITPPNSTTGYSLGSVTASDANEGDRLTYSITSGDTSIFGINNTSGELRYIGSGLDYETGPRQYTLTVRVTDQSLATDTATVTIQVTDVNEPPVNSQTIQTIQIGKDGRFQITIDLSSYFTDPDTLATDPQFSTIRYRLEPNDERISIQASDTPSLWGISALPSPELTTGTVTVTPFNRVGEDVSAVELAGTPVTVDLEIDLSPNWVYRGNIKQSAPPYSIPPGQTITFDSQETPSPFLERQTFFQEENEPTDEPLWVFEVFNTGFGALDALNPVELRGDDAADFRIEPFPFDPPLTPDQANTHRRVKLFFSPSADFETKRIYEINLRVTTATGLSSSLPIRVAIQDVNERPFLSRPFTFHEENVMSGGTWSIDLENPPDGGEPFFADPEGRPLTYEVTASWPGVVEVEVVGSVATVTGLLTERSGIRGRSLGSVPLTFNASDGTHSAYDSSAGSEGSEPLESVMTQFYVVLDPSPTIDATATSFQETPGTEFRQATLEIPENTSLPHDLGVFSATLDHRLANHPPHWVLKSNSGNGAERRRISCDGVSQNPLWSSRGDDDHGWFLLSTPTTSTTLPSSTTTTTFPGSRTQLSLNAGNQTVTVLDYENPLDADRNNSYRARLAAQVSQLGETEFGCDGEIIDLTVVVTDIQESGTVALSTTASNATPVPAWRGTMIQAEIVDQDLDEGADPQAVWVWEREETTDNWVPITGADQSSYRPVTDDVGKRVRARITYTDRLAADQTAVSDPTAVILANDPPMFTNSPQTFDLAENASGETTPIPLGTITATDPDSSATPTFALVNQPENDPFTLDTNSGVLSYTGPALDHESFGATPTLDLVVAATDDRGATTTATIAVRVTDVDEPPPFPVTIPDQAIAADSVTTLDLRTWVNDPEEAGLVYRVRSLAPWQLGVAIVNGEAGTPDSDCGCFLQLTPSGMSPTSLLTKLYIEASDDRSAAEDDRVYFTYTMQVITSPHPNAPAEPSSVGPGSTHPSLDHCQTLFDSGSRIPGQPRACFLVDTPVVNEGETAAAILVLEEPLTEDGTFGYQADGLSIIEAGNLDPSLRVTAAPTPGADFDDDSLTATLRAGETLIELTVPVFDDAIIEEREAFWIELTDFPRPIRRFHLTTSLPNVFWPLVVIDRNDFFHVEIGEGPASIAEGEVARFPISVEGVVPPGFQAIPEVEVYTTGRGPGFASLTDLATEVVVSDPASPAGSEDLPPLITSSLPDSETWVGVRVVGDDIPEVAEEFGVRLTGLRFVWPESGRPTSLVVEDRMLYEIGTSETTGVVERSDPVSVWAWAEYVPEWAGETVRSVTLDFWVPSGEMDRIEDDGAIVFSYELGPERYDAAVRAQQRVATAGEDFTSFAPGTLRLTEVNTYQASTPTFTVIDDTTIEYPFETVRFSFEESADTEVPVDVGCLLRFDGEVDSPTPNNSLGIRSDHQNHYCLYIGDSEGVTITNFGAASTPNGAPIAKDDNGNGYVEVTEEEEFYFFVETEQAATADTQVAINLSYYVPNSVGGNVGVNIAWPSHLPVDDQVFLADRGDILAGDGMPVRSGSITALHPTQRIVLLPAGSRRAVVHVKANDGTLAGDFEASQVLFYQIDFLSYQYGEPGLRLDRVPFFDQVNIPDPTGSEPTVSFDFSDIQTECGTSFSCILNYLLTLSPTHTSQSLDTTENAEFQYYIRHDLSTGCDATCRAWPKHEFRALEILENTDIQFMISTAMNSVSESAGSMDVRFEISGDREVVSLPSFITLDYEITPIGDTVAGEDFGLPTVGGTTNGQLNSEGNITGTVRLESSGELHRDLTIPITDDQISESNQGFTIQITGATHRLGALESIYYDDASTQINITDDDPITVYFRSLDTGPVGEGASARFTAELTGGVHSSPVVLPLTFNPGADSASPGNIDSATVGSDYTPFGSPPATWPTGSYQTSIAWPVGTRELALSIPVTDDEIVEALETFSISSGTPAGTTGEVLTLATNMVTSVSIRDNDQAEVSITGSASGERVSEGENADFTARLVSGTLREIPLQVNWETVTDTAGLTDFTSSSGTLVFPVGVNSMTINVPVTDDDWTEDAERFGVMLSDPTPTKLTIGVARAWAEIAANDPYRVSLEGPANPVVEDVGSTDPMAPSTGSIQAEFELVFDEDYGTLEEAIDVQLSTGDEEDTATPGVDYQTRTDHRFRIEPGGSNRVPFYVEITQDSLSEPAETLTLTIDRVDSGVLVGSVVQRQAQATIAPSDPVSVTLTGPTDPVNEGDTASFTVNLSGGVTTAPVVVTYALSGEAEVLSDYADPGETLTIPTGVSSATIPIPALTDNLDEDTENLTLTLTEVTGGGGVSSLGDDVSATAQIRDINDPPTIRLQVNPVSVSEGSVTPVVLSAVVEGSQFSVPHTLTVSLSESDGDSLADLGWTTADGSVDTAPKIINISAGATAGSNTLSLSVVDDSFDEVESESVGISGSLSVGGVSVTGPTVVATSVSVLDNDDPEVTVEFSAASYPVTEGDSVDLSLTLTKIPERSVTIPLVTAPGSETITGLPGSVTFAADESTQTLTVSVPEDSQAQGDRTVTVLFGASLPARVSAGLQDETELAISDDEVAPNRISLSLSPDELSEDAGASPVTVTATLGEGSISLSEDLVLTLSVAGLPSPDFTVSLPDSPTLTIPAGSGSGELDITVTPIDDIRVEGDETITVSATAPSGFSVVSDEITILANDQATISLSDPVLSVAEGSLAQVTATLSAPLAEQVTVNWSTVVNGSASAEDFTASSGTLSFGPSDTASATRTLSIPITADELSEGEESFGVVLSGLSVPAALGGRVSLSNSSVDVTVAASDPVSVNVSGPSVPVDEGDSVEFTVNLSGGVTTEQAVVTFELSGEAKAPGDYTAPSSTSLTIPTGVAGGTVSIQTLSDTLDEETENLTLTLTEVTGGGGMSSLGNPKSASAQIRDTNDPPTVRLQVTPSSVSEGSVTPAVLSAAVEGSQFSSDHVLTVSLSETDGDSQADLGWTTSDGSVDTASRTITIPAGATTGSNTLSLTVVDDDLDEAETETVNINGALSVSGTPVTGSQIVATSVSVLDDDSPPITVGFSTSRYPVTEGGSVDLTLVLSEVPKRAVTIPIESAPGSETITGLPGSITFGTSQTIRNLRVSVPDDSQAQGDRDVLVRLGTSLPFNVAAGTQDTATLVITDDDTAPNQITLSLSPDELEEDAGETGVTVTATLGDGTISLPDDLVLTLSVANLTSPDFTVSLPDPPTLTILSGSGSGSVEITVTPTDDNRVEGDETLTVDATAPSEYTVRSDDLTILANDLATISLSDSVGSVAEGSLAQVTATLSAPLAEQVTVNWSTVVNGSASAEDFTASSGTLSFGPSDAAGATRTLSIPISEDQLSEGEEAFGVELSGLIVPTAIGGRVSLSNSSVDVRIADSDPVSVSVEGPSTPVDEGGAAEFIVSLSGGVTTAPVMVSFELSGEAEASTDYTAPSSTTFTIPTGVASSPISVETLTDTLFEGTEELILTLSGVSGGGGLSPLGDDVSATAQIRDINGPPTVRLWVSPDSVSEGSASPVVLSAAVEGSQFSTEHALTVSLAESDGDSLADLGWTISDGSVDTTSKTITIPAGSTAGSSTLSLFPVDDSFDEEETETVEVNGVLSVSGTPVTGSQIVATSVSVLDNDDPEVTVEFSAASYPVTEGDSVDLVLVLSKAPERSVTLPLVTAPGSETITGLPGSVTFTADETSQVLTVSVPEDSQAQGDRTVTVLFGALLPARVTAGPQAETDLSIADNDIAPSQITLSLTPDELEEDAGATPVTVTATLGDGSISLSEDLVLTLSVAGLPSPDFTVVLPDPPTLTIPAGFGSGDLEVTITPTDDSRVEGDETLTVDVTALSGYTVRSADLIILANDQATVSLSDPVGSVAESNSALVTVTLSAPVGDTVMVDWATVLNGSASAGDFTASSGILSFGPADAAGATRTLSIPITADELSEGEESFGVVLSGLSVPAALGGRVSLSNSSVGVSITESDPVSVSVAGPSVPVNEGGVAEFVVSLSGGTTTTPAVVAFVLSGDAESPGDYTAPSSTSLTIPTGVASGTVSIQTLSDNLDEDTEDLTFTLSNISGGGGISMLGDQVSATAQISDTNDPPTVRLGVSPGSVSEGSVTPVVLSAAVEGSQFSSDHVLTVSLSETDGDDLADLGWTTSDGSVDTTSKTITIPAGATAGNNTLSLSPVDDSFDEEETETVEVSGVLSVSGTPVTGPQVVATSVSIQDDDHPEITVAFDAASFPVTEGGSVDLVLTLSKTPERSVTVQLVTGPGSETITGLPGSVTFAADETSQTLTVSVPEDSVAQGIRTVPILLSNTLPSRVTAGSQSQVDLSIADNDIAPSQITLSLSPVELEEDAGATEVTVTATLGDGTISLADDLDLTLTVSSLPSPDIMVVFPDPPTLTIPAGSPTGTVDITVTPTDDNRVEGPESFTVDATAPSTFTVIPDDLAILANDQATITLTNPNVTVMEGGIAQITVALSTPLSAPVSVDWFTIAQTATATSLSNPAGDFTPRSGTFTFSTDETAGANRTITIPTTQDDLAEPEETFRVELSRLVIPNELSEEQVTLSTPNAEVTIEPSDPVQVSLSGPFVSTPGGEIEQTSVDEGEVGGYNVELSNAIHLVPMGVSLSFSGDATDRLDYTHNLARTVTIPVDSTSAFFQIRFLEDGVYEGDEELTITIEEVASGGIPTEIGSPLTTRVIDGEQAPPPPGPSVPPPVDPGDDEEDPMPDGPIDVDPDSPYRSFIISIIDQGISRGCDPPENLHFCPNRALIRGEAATFLTRAFGLPPLEDDYFHDDNGNTHERDINSLAAPDITRGCNPPINDRYCPLRRLTRAEMASFLVRAFELELSENDYFDDDEESVHELQINTLAELEISRGCNPPDNTRYCPEREITRQEMAVFLYRTIELTKDRTDTLNRLPELLKEE